MSIDEYDETKVWGNSVVHAECKRLYQRTRYKERQISKGAISKPEAILTELGQVCHECDLDKPLSDFMLILHMLAVMNLNVSNAG